MDVLQEFEAHRRFLFALAYRMLGSALDAEDIVQEAFLRWQGAARADVANSRAFLATVVSRLCIDHRKSARARSEQLVAPPLPEPVLTSEFAATSSEELADSLSIAFLVVLQRLSPTERAVFLLREVFDFPYDDIAAMVGKSVESCRQAGARARAHMATHRPRYPAPPDVARRLVTAFVQATRDGDLESLLHLLAPDVTFVADTGERARAYGRVRALRRPLHGALPVARFLLAGQGSAPPTLSHSIADVNGRPAVLTYQEGKLYSVLSFDVADERIVGLYVVGDPAKLTRLGARSVTG